MKAVSRAARMALAVGASLALVLTLSPSAAGAAGNTTAAALVAAPAAANASQTTWHLLQQEQRSCFEANRQFSTYFVGFISGYWTTHLHVTVQGLPAGTVSSLPHPPIPPRSNGDSYIGTAAFSVTLPPLDFGDYRAEMSITDGRVTQKMPILMRAQENWGC